jgi:HPt (histidine-containing phosphotransfer) domain-containing protein
MDEGMAEGKSAPLVDVSDLLRRMGGRQDQAVTLLHEFCEAQTLAPARLADALAVGDWPRARQVAHRLGGSAANLGLRALATEALRIEALLHSGNPPPDGLDVTLLTTLFTETAAAVERDWPLPASAAMADIDVAATLRLVDRQLATQDCEVLETLPTLLPHLPENGRDAFAKAVQSLNSARARVILRELAAGMEITLD